MRITLLKVLVACTAALAAGCGGDGDARDDVSPSDTKDLTPDTDLLDVPTDGVGTPWTWSLPEGFPTPFVPPDNPMTTEKVELGRHLFYDTRLSGNGTQSCGSCHFQELAFSDGIRVSVGSTGESTPRNSLSLTNVAYNATFTWVSPVLEDIEAQIAIPLFGEMPVEMGVVGHEAEILQRLRDDPQYIDLFGAAFPDADDPFDFVNVRRALASFVRTMISGGSPYDRYVYGRDPTALTDEQLLGMSLFFSEDLECHHCHGGFNFTQSTVHDMTAFIEKPFHNTGLYNIGGDGSYPADNTGLFVHTGEPADMGKFRAPTLRNIAVTGPYLHDGSVATLEEVIRIYEAGGRNITEGPFTGDGRANPYKSPFVHGFILTDEERDALLAFLESLTDPDFLQDPKFADPFAE